MFTFVNLSTQLVLYALATVMSNVALLFAHEAGCVQHFDLLSVPIRFVRFYCVTPEVDPVTQSHRGCAKNGSVMTQCYTAPNINCSSQLETVGEVTVTKFMRPFPCRYV